MIPKMTHEEHRQWSHDGADCRIRYNTLLRAVCSVTAADTRFLLIGWTLEMDTVKYLRGLNMRRM